MRVKRETDSGRQNKGPERREKKSSVHVERGSVVSTIYFQLKAIYTLSEIKSGPISAWIIVDNSEYVNNGGTIMCKYS